MQSKAISNEIASLNQNNNNMISSNDCKTIKNQRTNGSNNNTHGKLEKSYYFLRVVCLLPQLAFTIKISIFLHFLGFLIVYKFEYNSIYFI
jgi:hypothetical protein